MRIKANTYKKNYFQNAELYRKVDSNNDLIVERYTLHISDGQKKVAQLDTQTGSSADKIEIIAPAILDESKTPGATITSITTEPNPEPSTKANETKEKKTFLGFLFSKSVENTAPAKGATSEDHKANFLNK